MAKGLCGWGDGMSLKKWWLWALLGLLAIYALMLMSKWRNIEGDIQTRTAQALTAEGHDWASVDLHSRGRDVLLTGNAPSEEARLAAIEVAENVRGVRVVDVDGEITPVQLSSASFNLKADGDNVVLSGAMPSQDLIDATVTKANSAYGAERVVNNLTVDANTSKPGWLNGLQSLLPGLATAVRDVDIQVSDDGSSIAGVVENDKTKAGLLHEAEHIFTNGFTEDVQVMSSGPSAEELAAAAKAEEERMAAEAEAAKKAENDAVASNCQAQLADARQGGRINFETSSATINAESYPLLDRLIGVMNNCKDSIRSIGRTIEIAGHTDSQGDDASNLELSNARAASVRTYMSNAGVPSDLISAKGYGETSPIATNDTEEGRAQNRRIQFEIKQ